MDMIEALTQWGFEDIKERNVGENVFLATSAANKEKVAIKVLNKNDLSKHSLDRGLEIAPRIEHKFIVKSLGVYQTPLVACLVTEIFENNLFRHLALNGPLSESSAKKLFSQLAEAICYLHHKTNIAHGDIKCSGILLDNDFNVKLSTFFKRNISANEPLLESDTESLHYTAPEIIQNEDDIDYRSADMFSLGVVLYVMLLSAYPPRTLSEGIDFKNPFSAKVSVQFVHLMRMLLCGMPSIRYTIGEVLDHEWLRENSSAPDKENDG